MPIAHRDAALEIWRAGLAAVDSQRLVREQIVVERDQLLIADRSLSLRDVRRIAVVGAGKAGAGMTVGLEEALGPALLQEKQVTGWVNVPADCLRPTRCIHLHAARAAGSNEPTKEGVVGSQRILELVAGLGDRDLCICLLSGGASALLPAPAPGVTLADKLAVTQFLSAAGANIEELNTVRKHLSAIKGGRLAQACGAGLLATLVISDVPGDSLDVIGSGPTVPDSTSDADALAVLQRYRASESGISRRVFDALNSGRDDDRFPIDRTATAVIGSNAVAVDAAARHAERLGFSPISLSSSRPEGPAEEVGVHLATELRMSAAGQGADCVISGGEPVVELAPTEIRGKGGRNQQLVAAAALELAHDAPPNFALLSGGTDGEDGPTDAAGAVIDAEVLRAIAARGLDVADHLRRNDAYRLFDQLGALIRTGPTHTNVCDVRVVCVPAR